MSLLVEKFDVYAGFALKLINRAKLVNIDPADFITEAFLMVGEEATHKQIINAILKYYNYETSHRNKHSPFNEVGGQKTLPIEIDIEDKTCGKCKVPKSVHEFYQFLDKSQGRGYRYTYYCKSCIAEIRAKQRQECKGKYGVSSMWYRNNRDWFKKKYHENAEKYRLKSREYYAANKEAINKRKKTYLSHHPEKKSVYRKKNNETRKEKIRNDPAFRVKANAVSKRYHERNKERRNAEARAYDKRRKEKDKQL